MAQSNTARATHENGAVDPAILTVSREIATSEGVTVELDFMGTGVPTSDDERLAFLMFKATRFVGNIRSDVERNGKTYTADELQAKWSKYVLGSPRELGTGESIKSRAAAEVADALLPSGETYAKGDKGKMVKRILAALDDGTASDRTKGLYDAALAKLKAEAEAKRGTATKKTSVKADSIAI